MTKNTALWTTVKDDLRIRRERRAALRQLRADLATYRTPAEIEDLLAMVDNNEDAAGSVEAELIRSVLHDNLASYHATRQAPLQQVVGL